MVCFANPVATWRVPGRRGTLPVNTASSGAARRLAARRARFRGRAAATAGGLALAGGLATLFGGVVAKHKNKKKKKKAQSGGGFFSGIVDHVITPLGKHMNEQGVM